MFPPFHPCVAISQRAVRHRDPCYFPELLHDTHQPLTKPPVLLHMQKKRLWHQQISQTSQVRSPNRPRPLFVQQSLCRVHKWDGNGALLPDGELEVVTSVASVLRVCGEGKEMEGVKFEV